MLGRKGGGEKKEEGRVVEEMKEGRNKVEEERERRKREGRVLEEGK